MNIKKIAAICLFIYCILGKAYAVECMTIHAPSGVIDETNTTAQYSVSQHGIHLSSKGKLTIRYPLVITDDMTWSDLFITDAGYTDSYADANIEIKLISQQLAPTPRFRHFPTVTTNIDTLFDSKDEDDKTGYRRTRQTEFIPSLQPREFAYSLEVIMQKTKDFNYRNAGRVTINNMTLCPSQLQG